MLVIDTETATENSATMAGFDSPAWNPYAQTLLFGCARLYMRVDDSWLAVTEFTFYPSCLPKAGIARLRSIIRRQTITRGNANYLRDEPAVEHRLVTLDQFIELFIDVAYDNQGLVVGFNLPFDLSRLACGWGKSTSKWYAGGFSLKLTDSPYRPRLGIRNIDSKRAFIGFTGFKDPHGKRKVFRGNFLDLRTLAFALTSESLSLDSACKKLGVVEGKGKAVKHGVITSDYVRYNRQDVIATARLAEKLLEQFDEHPISREYRGRDRCKQTISECKVFSPASLAKAYLSAMGIRVPRTPAVVEGYTMAAYYGGRSEVTIRNAEIPVTYLDFRSMYPTVNRLMGLWEHVTAGQIKAVNATDEIVSLVRGITPESLFRQETWKTLNAIVLLNPNGDILPVRGKYTPNGSWKIGINPYHSDESQWYALPDVVASALLNGKMPQIVKALRFVPVGQRRGLRPVRFGGVVSIDPRTDDFFAVTVQERAKAKAGIPPYASLSEDARRSLQGGLKTLANSGSYGVFAEMNVNDRSECSAAVFGNAGGFECTTDKPEEPGRFAMPHLATLVTAGARLMLALLERCVMDSEGLHTFTDTDSMALVSSDECRILTISATQNGRTEGQAVKSLSWREVDSIAGRFASLNPFDTDTVPGSILELKEHNFDDNGNRIQLYTRAISPKRYVMYGKDKVPVTDIQSSLGYLLNPSIEEDGEDAEWIQQFWRAVAEDTELRNLPFADRLAVRRISITSHEILDRFKSLNAGKPYEEQVKPFNFMLALSEHPFFRLGDTAACLVAPYERDPAKWLDLPWLNYQTNTAVTLTGPRDWRQGRSTGNTMCPVTSVELLRRYLRHPEPNFLAFDGTVCDEDTAGVLSRRPIRALQPLAHIGKETNEISNRLAQAGMEEDKPTEYAAADAFWLGVVLPTMALMPRKEVAARLGVTPRTLERWIKNEGKPTDTQRIILRLNGLVSDNLKLMGFEPQDVVGNLSSYPAILEAQREQLRLALAGLIELHGQREAARGLEITRSLLAKYADGGLPSDARRLALTAQRLGSMRSLDGLS